MASTPPLRPRRHLRLEVRAERVGEAFKSPDGALKLLAALPGHGNEQEEARDLMHLLLHGGLEPAHPWLKRHLREHVRQAYIDTALGLGLSLEGGMACWVGALEDNRVAVPWLPAGMDLVVGRYPIRDSHSLRVVRNSVAPVPEGSIGLGEDLLTSLDGDADGDYCWIAKDPDVVESVKRLHESAPPRLERSAKARKKTPLPGLARVAVENMGAVGIGTPTWLVGAALASGRPDLVPALSDQIQNGVESLKWDTRVDWEVVSEMQGVVPLPEFLELIQKRKTFQDEAPEIGPCGGFEESWNDCVSHWQCHAAEGVGSVRQFRDRLPCPSGEHVAEVQLVRDFYNAAVRESNGDLDAIRSAVTLVRAWGAGKKDNRDDWAKTCYRGYDLSEKWVRPDQRASYETNLTWGKILKEELAHEEHHTYVTHPETGLMIRVFPRSRAMKIAKEQGHEWAGARKRRKKSAAEKRKDTELRIQRLAEDKINEALRTELDRIRLDERADWLAAAILDSARCDSLRQACSALGLKREREVQTRYGKEKESWRDRLARAIEERAFTPRLVFLMVLTHEQGWHHRTKGTALRERLLVELKIDRRRIEKSVRAATRRTAPRKRKPQT